ncbi:superinfection immunity protein [Burkholderia pseudomallei]
MDTFWLVFDPVVKFALGLVLLAAIIWVYMTPWRIARNRGHRHVEAIFVLNVFFGVTVLGWWGALIWALTQPAQGGKA